jgi:hypothetical protein
MLLTYPLMVAIQEIICRHYPNWLLQSIVTRLAVNRLGEKGSWDLGELEAEFRKLVIADAPIEISGFGSDEIDQAAELNKSRLSPPPWGVRCVHV